MWSPTGQPVLIPTPAQPTKHYGIGAVDYHTGETVVLVKRHTRRQEIAELLEALRDKPATGTSSVAWENAGTPEDDEVEIVVRAAAGRLVLWYLPTYSPWLNPIELRWRQLRREVTHNALFPTVQSLLAAAREFFDRDNREPARILSVIGSHAQNII
jgi:transposase